jgi:peptide/nickel transport system permease protein
MIRLIARRIVLAIPVLWGVTLLVFMVLHLVPGDPVATILGEEYENVELREQIRHELGLDRPIWVQYGKWMAHVLRGDLGRSLLTKEPALHLIADRVPTTAVLAFVTMGISLIIAIPLGGISATHKDSVTDSLVRVLAVTGVTLPVFWLGIMMIVVFSLKLRLLPASGGISQHGLKALILPSAVLGAAYAALMTRVVRSEMVDALQQDYIRTAYSKGLFSRTIYFRHALRNAMIPVGTVIGTQFGALLSGAVLTEHVFGLPGLGSLLIESVYRRDFPLIQAAVLSLRFRL